MVMKTHFEAHKVPTGKFWLIEWTLLNKKITGLTVDEQSLGYYAKKIMWNAQGTYWKVVIDRLQLDKKITDLKIHEGSLGH